MRGGQKHARVVDRMTIGSKNFLGAKIGILGAKYAIRRVSEKLTSDGSEAPDSRRPIPCNLSQLKNVVSEGTSSPAHNYGYIVRSSHDFVKLDIGALRTDRQTCVKYNSSNSSLSRFQILSLFKWRFNFLSYCI